MSIQNNEKEVIIRPADKAVRIRWREIYGYRHLLWGMVYRNVKIQFSQTYLSFFGQYPGHLQWSPYSP